MSQKKAWTKSSKKDKVYQITLFSEQADYDAAIAAIKTMKIVTVSTVCDKCKVGISLARKMIHKLVSEGVLKPAATSNRLDIYVNPVKFEAKAEKVEPTRATKAGKADKAGKAEQ